MKATSSCSRTDARTKRALKSLLPRPVRAWLGRQRDRYHPITTQQERKLLTKWASLQKQYPLVTYHPAVQRIDKRNIAAAKWYLCDFEKFVESSKLAGFDAILSFPILTDRHSLSGSMSGHYFHADLLVAQKIFKKNPRKHVDIGSRQDGFVAHVASFREIEVFDIRPQIAKVDNVILRQADLMQLDKSLIGYCDSVSSLHAIEHFGLGRYGDTIDPEGHIKAIDNVYHILQEGGTFYFAIPIGEQRVEFNAHRVFDVGYLLGLFNNKFEVETFSYVDDVGELHKNASCVNPGCNYGCGIFELRKA